MKKKKAPSSTSNPEPCYPYWAGYFMGMLYQIEANPSAAQRLAREALNNYYESTGGRLETPREEQPPEVLRQAREADVGRLREKRRKMEPNN